MTRRQTILGVTLFAVACLGIGVLWTLRTEPPSINPWWSGKDAKVRMEVWEPGKDMATFGMTMSKKTIDGMVALGLHSKVQVGNNDLDLRQYWREIQALPPGERFKIAGDDGETTYVWIETPDLKLPPVRVAQADSSGVPADTVHAGVRSWSVGWGPSGKKKR